MVNESITSVLDNVDTSASNSTKPSLANDAWLLHNDDRIFDQKIFKEKKISEKKQET